MLELRLTTMCVYSYKWNPDVGTNCASLWLGYYVCVAA